jgi:thiosulfate/3-mercaptopyruvate sulfurtransferase
MTNSTPYQTIVSTEIASAHIDDPDWAFIDCRFDLLKPDWGLAEYRSAHVAGAVYADLNQDLSSPVTPQTGRHPLPESSAIVNRFSSWGIGPRTQVVMYDAAGGTFAARLWWLLKYYGHIRAAVLDGSMGKWLSENRPMRSGVESRPSVQFEGSPNPGMWVSTAEVETLRRDPSFMLIDARASARFHGEQEFIDPIAGHIPGAVNRFTAANLTKDGIFLPPDRLKAEFTTLLGSLPPANAIFYCGSGVTSCHHLLAMEHAGLPGARLYPGSWSEWIRDPNRPIEKNV